eukprot:TRINITY_DN18165_c0_g1_i1.p1 TRINITY_DN18165_c0_g1~~TRINITY_DN18165_c0_g1_i1.p1  ORF type:complete len:154 (+),score=32.97 TRINITY_DN18165_c0_g1_i1:202-663(+)
MNLDLKSILAGVGCAALGGACALMIRGRTAPAIQRWGVTDRAAAAVQYEGKTLYLSGQVGDIPTLATSDVTAQTRQTLAKIDKLLAAAGTSREHILSAQIWLKDIEADFKAMNVVWNDWVGKAGESKGVRACVESKMARETLLVEIKVVAAVP